MTTNAYIVDYCRTPIGRFGGNLASVRPDNLAAETIRAIVARNPDILPDEVVFGCTNQAGEDCRNVARFATLLGGLPESVPAITLNRLCASGMDAVAYASRMIQVGDADLIIAGGVESMSRAPFVMAKQTSAYGRNAEAYDTTIGWRFVNPAFREKFGTESMPETGENVAEEHGISRPDQDAFAHRSQMRAAAAIDAGRLAEEIVAIAVSQRKGTDIIVAADEHPRPGTTLEALARLRTPFRENGTITAGNCSGVNDGAAALVVASEAACERWNLEPIARIAGFAAVGVAPRVMGIGPVPATRKLLERTGVSIDDIDVIELNEAFASQCLAALRDLGVDDDAEHVNPNGGAIALGHPLGMTGARITGTAARELRRRGGRYALATMCVGVGQGAAILLERP